MIVASGQETWAKGSGAPALASESASSLLGSPALRRPTGSLELHWRRGNRRGPKYFKRTLVGETPEPWKEGQGPTGNQLGKGPIESGKC